MTDPIVPVTPVTPTQVSYPGKAVLRTVVAMVAGFLLSLAVAALALQLFLPQFLEAIEEALPPEWFAVVSSWVGTIILISGAITRVMAIPGVNEWLKKLKLGATPAPSVHGR